MIAPGRRKSPDAITLVTPDARLVNSTIGIVVKSTSPACKCNVPSSAACCASKKPCVRTAARGSPVLPLVNVISAGVFGSHETIFRGVTKHFAIDTEPVWTPDGQNLVFTSDRGGKAQLYQAPAGGGDATRVTFAG